MNLLLIVAGTLAGLTAIFLVFRIVILSRERSQEEAKRYERMKPIIEKLEHNETIPQKTLDLYAANPSTREALFYLLSEVNKAHLFPDEYYTLEKSAEANMVQWLEYPSELAATPARIEFIKKVTLLEEKEYDYYCFKFLTHEPHWAAKNRWMLGVAGPYFRDSKPYDLPSATFSRLTKLSEGSAESEVDWLHRRRSKKRNA